jgi:hypothetical protein
MATSAWNKFNCFVEDCAEKVHNLGSDTLKVALTNSLPVATNTVLGDITQIANGNGYTTGGAQATQVTSAQTSGTYKLVLNDPSWTAVTGSMGTFRYCVLYNDTSTSDSLIAWFDYGATITLGVGESFTTDFDASGGALTLA